MKVSDLFLAAKKDKNIRSVIVSSREEHGVHRDYIRICIDAKIKYTDRTEVVSVETDTEVNIKNFHKGSDVASVFFHLSLYSENFVRTFLDAIKKDSEVYFVVVAFNDCDSYKELGITSHQLYARVDNKEYFLSSYTGRQNTASPVQLKH